MTCYRLSSYPRIRMRVDGRMMRSEQEMWKRQMSAYLNMTLFTFLISIETQFHGILSLFPVREKNCFESLSRSWHENKRHGKSDFPNEIQAVFDSTIRRCDKALLMLIFPCNFVPEAKEAASTNQAARYDRKIRRESPLEMKWFQVVLIFVARGKLYDVAFLRYPCQFCTFLRRKSLAFRLQAFKTLSNMNEHNYNMLCIWKPCQTIVYLWVVVYI